MPQAEPGLQCSLLAVCTQRGASSSSVPNEPHLLTRNRPNLFPAFQGSLRAISSNNAHSLSLPNRYQDLYGPRPTSERPHTNRLHFPRSPKLSPHTPPAWLGSALFPCQVSGSCLLTSGSHATHESTPTPATSPLLPQLFAVLCPVVVEPGSLRQNSGPTSLWPWSLSKLVKFIVLYFFFWQYELLSQSATGSTASANT